MTSSNGCCSSTKLEQPYGNITTRCTPGWHRRPLPKVAIPFNSETGKRIFREALLTDGLHGYFSLAETFHTQVEPSYCGPGTLSMG
jgi:glutathione gamma-glutamylcysteinyltransferase